MPMMPKHSVTQAVPLHASRAWKAMTCLSRTFRARSHASSQSFPQLMSLTPFWHHPTEFLPILFSRSVFEEMASAENSGMIRPKNKAIRVTLSARADQQFSWYFSEVCCTRIFCKVTSQKDEGLEVEVGRKPGPFWAVFPFPACL